MILHILFLIVLLVVVLLVTVVSHEAGHFFAARKSGMTVEEFGFGIPPRLFAWKRGETEYSINAIPIGGFVKIAGENGQEAGSPIPYDKQFESKPWYLKSFVLVAGVLCNIILAFVLFTAAYLIGMPATTPGGVPTIISVSQKTPAAAAGLADGDTVQAVSVGGVSVTPLDTDTLHNAINKSAGPVEMTYTHNKVSHTVQITPEVQKDGRIIGVAIEPLAIVRQSLWGAMQSAYFQIIYVITAVWYALSGLVVGLFAHFMVSHDLMGPVGLAREVGGAANIGFTYLLAFTAAISVNLAVLNIMPFPALDGGRLVVVLLERVFNRKFSANVIGIIHAAGFILLLALMVFLTVGDIWKR